MNKPSYKTHAIRQRLHELCPFEFLLLTSVLIAACPLVTGIPLVFAVLSAIAYLAILSLILPWRDVVIGMAAITLVVISWTILNYHGSNHIINQLYRGQAYSTVNVQVTDRTLSVLPEATPAKSVQCEILSLKSDNIVRPTFGRALLSGLKDIPLEHGDIIQVTGSIQIPGQYRAHDNHDRYWESESLANFNHYLRSRRIAVTIRADQVTLLEKQPSWLNKIRASLVERAVSGLQTPEAKAMTQALFFGTRQELDSDTRCRLIFSGTMHIFSVSGMHVAVLAFVLLLVLRFVPYQYRYWLLTGLLTLYVVFTGMQVPAIRALIMIGVYSLLKTGFFRMPSLKLLVITGSLMIAFNPYGLVDAGFFFSFVVTGFLLMLAEKCSEMRPIENLLDHYKARNKRQYLRRVLSGLFWLFIGCLVAFVAGCGISLFCFGLVLPGSIVANLLLAGLLNLLFPLIILKIIFASVAPLNLALSWFLDKLFDGFGLIVESSAKWFPPADLAIPILGIIIIFYLLLIALIRNRKPRWFYIIFAIILLILAWSSRVLNPAPAMVAVIRSPYSETHGVLIVDPGASYAIVLNLPLQSAGVVHRLLKERGVNYVNALIFSANTKDSAADAAKLSGLIKIEKILLLDPQIRSKPFAEMLAALNIATITLPEAKYLSSLWKIESEKSALLLEYSNNASHINVNINMLPEQINVQINGRTYEPEMEKSNLLEFFTYE